MTQPCNDDNPEQYAGEPVDDGWALVPCGESHPGTSCSDYEEKLDEIERAGEVGGDGVDAGGQPEQPAS